MTGAVTGPLEGLDSPWLELEFLVSDLGFLASMPGWGLLAQNLLSAHVMPSEPHRASAPCPVLFPGGKGPHALHPETLRPLEEFSDARGRPAGFWPGGLGCLKSWEMLVWLARG